MDWVFCKIINKEIPAKVRYEDDNFLAFDDIAPKAETHVLLIPKKHIDSLAEATSEDKEIINQLLWKAKEIAKELSLDEYRLVTNSGESVGQTVKHLHFHLMSGQLGDIA